LPAGAAMRKDGAIVLGTPIIPVNDIPVQKDKIWKTEKKMLLAEMVPKDLKMH
jgi:hypothetical protein